MSTRGRDSKKPARAFEHDMAHLIFFIARVVGIVVILGGVLLSGCSALPKSEPRRAQPAPAETASPAVSEPAVTKQEPPAVEAAAPQPQPDPARGRKLFAALGCTDCHGHHAEGMGGEHADDDMTVPTLAQTRLPLQSVIAQVRHPHEYMRSYGVADVSDADLAAIYAYLQTLPTPANVVPSVLIQVPSAPTGTIRGVVYYAGTHTPVPDFDIYLTAVEIADGKRRYVYDTWFQPSTSTNADGVFEMPLIREGYYVLFESRKMQEMTAQNGHIALVQVVAGQATDVEVFVPR